MRMSCFVALLAAVFQLAPPAAPHAADFMPISVVITEVDDVGGGLEQGCCNLGPPDLYGIVAINGIVRETNRAPDNTSHIFPNWAVTVDVPAYQETVPISIRIMDYDDWPGDDDLADTSPVIGDNILDLILNVRTGQWAGESSSPAPCATGEADTRVRVCWAIRFPPHLGLSAVPSSSTIRAGGEATYTLNIEAIGDVAQANLRDMLPVGLNYVPGSVTGGAIYDAATRSIVYNGPIHPFSPREITYRAVVNERTPPGSVLETNPVLTGAGPEVRLRVPIHVGPSHFDGTLLLIYAAGDSAGLGSLSEAMLDLINRAERGAENPNVITLVSLDGPGSSDHFLYYLQPDPQDAVRCPTYQDQGCGGRYQLRGSVVQLNEVDRTPDAVSAFVRRGFNEYPDARQRIVVLAGHGGGWAPEVLEGQPSGHATQPGEDPLGGMLWDGHPGQALSTKELGQALRGATQSTGRRIDLLYLDACHMAMAEVAYEVRDSVELLLAAENTKWALFPYAEHLASITDTASAQDVGMAWARNEAAAIERDDLPYPYTFSLMDLRRLDELRSATDTLSAALRDVLADPGARLKISAAFSVTGRFDSNLTGTITPSDVYADLASFAYQINRQFADTSTVGDAAREVWQLVGGEYAAGGLVITQTHSAALAWSNPPWAWNRLGGVGIYLPLAQDDWRRGYYNTIAFGKDGSWDAFLDAWWSNRDTPPISECPEGGCEVPDITDPPVVSHVILLPLVGERR